MQLKNQQQLNSQEFQPVVQQVHVSSVSQQVLRVTPESLSSISDHISPLCVLWSGSVPCSQNKKVNKDLSGNFKYSQKYSVKASFDLNNWCTFLQENKGPESCEQYQYGLIFNCGYGFHNTCVHIKIFLIQLRLLNKENIQTAYFRSLWLSKIES